MTSIKIAWSIVGCIGVAGFFLPLVVNWYDRKWNAFSVPVMLIGLSTALQAWAYVSSH